MRITTFQAVKTTSKYPQSPYGDNSFVFETKEGSLMDIFHTLSEKFTLSIPLTKNTKAVRRADVLADIMVKKIDYIIIDLDDVKNDTDRQLCLKYFRDEKLDVVLGAGRRPYNIKGVLAVEPMTPLEGKEVLKKIQDALGDKTTVDRSTLNRAAYQAPINKHQVLLDQRGYKAQRIEIQEIIPTKVKVPNNIEQICINHLNRKGYSFDAPTVEGYKCSHPSEVKTKGGFSWSRNFPFSVTHWNPDRNDSVWEEVVKDPEYRKYQKDISKADVQETIAKRNNIKNLLSVEDRYLGPNTDTVNEFLSADIKNIRMLKIQSPMGTAKSTILEEVLQQCNKRGLTVMFLTNRISLADDICNKYDNIKHYLGSETEGNQYQAGDNLAVQIDSLFKYSTKYFDVVIMDEFTTTMVKMLSIEKYQTKITRQIFSLRKKKLVIADAFIFSEMETIFASPKETIAIDNDYRDQIDLNFYSQKDKFIDTLLDEAMKKPVTFSSGSTQMLRVVQLLADQRDISWVSIDSETPQKQRELIYKSMQNKKSKWNILMYSPTLTVGVSNENKIDSHYHFDSGLSMDVLSSVQMIKRTRQAKRINMFLSERIRYAPTNILKIQSNLLDYVKQDDDGDNIGITDQGMYLSQIIQVFNTLENRHEVAFKEILRLQFHLNGNVRLIQERVSPFVQKTSKLVKELLMNHKLDVFEAYKKLQPEEISEIEMKLFATSKRELYIKEFELIRTDETIKLSNEQMDILTKGEIKLPGTVEAYKNIKEHKILEDLRAGTVTEKVIKKHKIIPSEFGFKKSRAVWKLSEAILAIV